jgi:hypothetical protein
MNLQEDSRLLSPAIIGSQSHGELWIRRKKRSSNLSTGKKKKE